MFPFASFFGIDPHSREKTVFLGLCSELKVRRETYSDLFRYMYPFNRRLRGTFSFPTLFEFTLELFVTFFFGFFRYGASFSSFPFFFLGRTGFDVDRNILRWHLVHSEERERERGKKSLMLKEIKNKRKQKEEEEKMNKVVWEESSAIAFWLYLW